MQSHDSDVPLATSPITPEEAPSGMEDHAALLHDFAQIPTINRGWTFPASEGVRVSLQLSQRNLPANAQRRYLSSFLLNEAVLEHGELDTQTPLELKDVAMIAPSSSGCHTLIARSTNTTDKTSTILEIWNKFRVLHEIHIPSSLHGSIVNDGWFGTGAAWSPDERYIAYVAESPVSSTTPEWGFSMAQYNALYTHNDGDDVSTIDANATKKEKKNGGKKKEALQGAAPKMWRGKGEFKEDWGELNTGKRPPSLYVVNVETGRVVAVQGLPKESSCGQPQWSPDGKALLFVAWKHHSMNFPDFPQRLGIVFCFNRPCAVHAVAWPQPEHRSHDVPTALRIVPDSLLSSFSPRYTPDGTTLVFLSQSSAVTSGVHSATPSLLSLQWQPIARALEERSSSSSGIAPLPAPRILVDVVWTVSTPQDFPGIYSLILPEQPFVGNGSMLVMTSQWRSQSAVIGVNVNDGKVVRLTPENGSSWSLLASSREYLVASESHPGQPFHLYACHMPESLHDSPHSWSWSRISLPDLETPPPVLASILPTITSTVLQVQPTIGPQIPFEAVVLHSTDRQGPQPTIITPHGGPHTCYSAQYFMPLTYLVASGYNVVLINYRGSTGFGESSIQSLPGSIGTNDVADCMSALHAVVDAGFVDVDRVGVIGGSHGGFLTAHLMGQHPTAFKAGIVRNPVCNISLMVHLSDIPDWCYVESWGTELGRKKASALPTEEDMARFLRVSPISHVENVAAPLLMMLGACDRRVPLDDGKRYLDALRKRENAPETRLIVFPQDTHGLDKPQTEYEQWLTALWWLKTYMS